jgi:hypothetical protein
LRSVSIRSGIRFRNSIDEASVNDGNLTTDFEKDGWALRMSQSVEEGGDMVRMTASEESSDVCFGEKHFPIDAI